MSEAEKKAQPTGAPVQKRNIIHRLWNSAIGERLKSKRRKTKEAAKIKAKADQQRQRDELKQSQKLLKQKKTSAGLAAAPLTKPARIRRPGVKIRYERFLQRRAKLAIEEVSRIHQKLMDCQWGMPPQPEHFDHHIDLFFQWLHTRNSLWVERGAFGGLALQGGTLLELSCGDGFNSRNFYSLRSSSVIACDFDPSAIHTAKLKNSAPNLEYVLADIRFAMPEGTFNNIVWDAAIEHFTEAEIDKILFDIKSRLQPGGVVSGYTIKEAVSGGKHLTHHEYEFKSKEDLRRFFTPHFKYVTVFETVFPTRHNLYFWASDTEESIPFSPSWKAKC